MSDYTHIAWQTKCAKVRSFQTSSRAKVTLVKIELEVTSGYELSDILRQLHDAQMANNATPRGQRQ